jgi:hypothetical protein
MENWLNIIPILLILAASILLFVFQNWRQSIIALGVVFFACFILYLQVWPFTMSAAKLITGWMALAILSINAPAHTPINEKGITSNRIFRMIALLFIWLVAFLASNSSNQFFGIRPEIIFAAFAIFSCGLLQLGMTSRPFFVILGILTIFAGFELLYASIETSILINGLLAIMNLLIALVGSYLATAAQTGENE